jgi:hypothetical protein
MKKLSLSLLMFFGFLAFSTVHAQTATTVKAEKTNCQKPCTKATQASADYSFYSVLTAVASEEKASTPNSTTAGEKANVKKECKRTIAVNGKCVPNSEECLPPNCIIVPCSKKSSTIAVNQKPGAQK